MEANVSQWSVCAKLQTSRQGRWKRGGRRLPAGAGPPLKPFAASVVTWQSTNTDPGRDSIGQKQLLGPTGIKDSASDGQLWNRSRCICHARMHTANQTGHTSLEYSSLPGRSPAGMKIFECEKKRTEVGSKKKDGSTRPRRGRLCKALNRSCSPRLRSR